MQTFQSIVYLLLALVFMPSSAWAQAYVENDQIILRVSLSETEVWQGQPVLYHIDVLGKENFAQVSDLGRINVSGVHALNLESQGTRIIERIGNKTLNGMRYEFFLFPQVSGDLVIPEKTVEITTQTWGQDASTIHYQLTTPSLGLKVKRPPGFADGAEIISTDQLKVQQAWDANLEQLNAGSAITRRISISAENLSGIVFPPLAHQEIDGLAIYPKQPVVKDDYARGALLGLREEKITYLIEEAGNYRIPDITISWWNTATETLERETLEGVRFSAGSLTDIIMAPSRRPLVLGTGAILCLIAVAAIGYRKRLSSWLQSLRQQFVHSEKWHYLQLLKRCQQQRPTSDIFNATMAWLDSLLSRERPARLDEFSKNHAASNQDQQIIMSIVDDIHGGESIEHKSYMAAIKRARSNYLTEKHRQRQISRVLPELNG